MGAKLATRTLGNIFFYNKQKHANELVRKEQIVDFKKRQKEGVIISVLNFFLPIFPLWCSILNNLIIMDWYDWYCERLNDWYYERLWFTLFHNVPILYPLKLSK